MVGHRLADAALSRDDHWTFGLPEHNHQATRGAAAAIRRGSRSAQLGLPVREHIESLGERVAPDTDVPPELEILVATWIVAGQAGRPPPLGLPMAANANQYPLMTSARCASYAACPRKWDAPGARPKGNETSEP